MLLDYFNITNEEILKLENIEVPKSEFYKVIHNIFRVDRYFFRRENLLFNGILIFYDNINPISKVNRYNAYTRHYLGKNLEIVFTKDEYYTFGKAKSAKKYMITEVNGNLIIPIKPIFDYILKIKKEKEEANREKLIVAEENKLSILYFYDKLFDIGFPKSYIKCDVDKKTLTIKMPNKNKRLKTFKYIELTIYNNKYDMEDDTEFCFNVRSSKAYSRYCDLSNIKWIYLKVAEQS